MFEDILEAIEPFALGLILFAGASLAGWVTFTNTFPVGVATFAFGIILIIAYIIRRVKSKRQGNQ